MTMAKASNDIKQSVAELLAIREEHLAKAEEFHKSARIAMKQEARSNRDLGQGQTSFQRA
jgi:hypothetical protein